VGVDSDYDKTCFVIMPFGKEGSPERKQSDDTYKNIIKKAVEESGLGLRCVRADDISRSGNIVDDIINYAAKSRFVIADMTGRNANVFYELGIRHSLKDGTILLARSAEDIPFDVQTERRIIYSKDTIDNATKAKDTLRNFLVSMNQSVVMSDSPVLKVLYHRSGVDPEESNLASPHTIVSPKKPHGPGHSMDFERFSETVSSILRLMGYAESTFMKNFSGYTLYRSKKWQASESLGFIDLLVNRDLTLVAPILRDIPNLVRFYADFSDVISNASSILWEHASSLKVVIPVWGELEHKEQMKVKLATHFDRFMSANRPLLPEGTSPFVAGAQTVSLRISIWDEPFIVEQEKQHSGDGL